MGIARFPLGQIVATPDQRQRELQAFYVANGALHSKIFSMPAALLAAGQPNRAGAQRMTVAASLSMRK
jgi:hypothetical protein